MYAPSGDQVGLPSKPASLVRRVVSPLTMSSRYRSQPPLRFEANARVLPSGDQAGSRSSHRPVVRRVTWVRPGMGEMAQRWVRPLRRRASAIVPPTSNGLLGAVGDGPAVRVGTLTLIPCTCWAGVGRPPLLAEVALLGRTITCGVAGTLRALRKRTRTTTKATMKTRFITARTITGLMRRSFIHCPMRSRMKQDYSMNRAGAPPGRGVFLDNHGGEFG